MAECQLTALPRPGHRNRSASAVRILDLVIAVVGLAVFSPVMVLVAAALLIESGTPILFRQRRLGQTGQLFYMYKFRKFSPKLSGIGPVTIKDDPRLTLVGKFIEITKLNELPQLWNVIRGDMSIVGPRPETPNFADCFSPRYMRVLDHKPGIFGPVQVLFRDEASLYPKSGDPDQFYREVLFPVKADIDLTYFSNRTIVSDIIWIVRGVLAVMGWGSSRATVPNP
jgi:lipopolysaccharide/colanic/teichoic acid biosynthesis glycosyltransferase